MSRESTAQPGPHSAAREPPGSGQDRDARGVPDPTVTRAVSRSLTQAHGRRRTGGQARTAQSADLKNDIGH